MQTGQITYDPDYRSPSALESGDITFVGRSKVWCECAGLYLSPFACGCNLAPPPPANDNGIVERPRLIGLMGYAGAGKTEVKRILVERHGFVGPHIKEPLRAMCATLLREFGISERMIDRYLDGDLKRDVIPELRRSGTELQQFVGGQLGRDFCHENLWLDAWLAKADRILSSGGRVVQESVRYANEADSIRARGGVIVRVDRPGVGPINDHPSENLPTDPDVVLHNNDSIAALRARVNEIAA